MATNLPQPQIDYPKNLWESASSLSEQSIAAAVGRAQSLSFISTAPLQIPLEETVINLSHARDVLLDLVTRGRLVQIPLRIQARLLQETNKVASTLASLTNGNDLVQALESSVEELNATIWQFGLQNQSESVLGFERKMNELKAQAVEVNRSILRAKRLEKRLDEVEQLMGRLSELHNLAGTQSNEVMTVLGDIQSTNEKATQVSDEIQATFALVKQYETAIASATVSTRDAAAEAKESAASAEVAAEVVVDAKNEYDSLVERAKVLTDSLRSDADDVTEELRDAIKLLSEDTDQKVASLVERLDESDATRDETLRTVLASNTAIFKKATAEFDSEYREKYDSLDARSKALLGDHASSVSLIVDKLKAIEGQIDGAILKATGFTLFHSFQTRQEQLQASSRLWAKWLGACLIFSIASALTFLFMLPHFPSSGPAIYFKISLSLPFLTGVLFCGWQYTRERRLEEEYAFKSNISISLKPYQQLVDELVDKNNPEERAKYTAFIISSINKVFTSPTGLVFDDKEAMPTDSAKELLKATIDGATDIIKAKVK